MTNDGKDRRKDVRIPVSLLVKVKYEQVDEFIDHFATNISRGGIFIQSRKPYPSKTLLKFELQLKGGQTVLRGTGEVAWARSPSTEGSPKVPGMGVKFMKLDDPSKALVQRILEIKKGRKPATPAKSKAVKPAETAKPRPPASQTDDFDIDVDIDTAQASADADLDGLDVSVALPPEPPKPTIEVSEELGAETTTTTRERGRLK